MLNKVLRLETFYELQVSHQPLAFGTTPERVAGLFFFYFPCTNPKAVQAWSNNLTLDNHYIRDLVLYFLNVGMTETFHSFIL